MVSIPQKNDLVFVTYTEAPKRAARRQNVRDLVRKQALKAYYSPQGSDRVEERRKESDALDKKSHKKHMNRFRIQRGQGHGEDVETASEEIISLSSQRVYAFEPYITSLGPSAWELLDILRECIQMKSMSIHNDKAWFNFVMSESSMADATLCLVSLNRDFARGTIVSSATLHHRAAAMKRLKNEIEGGNAVDRETVAGTVALLAIAEDIEGNFTNSSAHFEGMAQIAKTCGGLRRFSSERSCMILKIIAWADLCHAAAWLSVPHLLGWFDVETVSVQNLEDGFDSSFRAELQRLTCPHLRSLMDILHRFPHPKTMHEDSPFDEQAHWHRLLMMTEQLVRQLKTRIPWEGCAPALSRAFTSAVQLYVPAVLWQRPLPREAASILVNEVFQELTQRGIRARPEEGRSPRNLLILWTLANTLTAVDEEDPAVKLFVNFQETLQAMDIGTEDELLDQLSCIAWSADSVDHRVVKLISPRRLT